MACETRLRPQQTLAQRNAEITKALRALEQKLLAGQVKVQVGPNGAVAFADWAKADRSDLTDACTYRVLASQNSWALKQAVQRAEAQSGRKVNPQAVAAGWHTHDGKTWGTH